MDKLTPHQFIRPHGPLTARLWPNMSSRGLEVLVEGWLDVAYAHDDVVSVVVTATQNKLAKAYVLHLAYMDIWQRMVAEPNAVTVQEKGGSSYTDKQRSDMRALADRYLEEFNGLIPSATAGPTPGTATIPVRLAW